MNTTALDAARNRRKAESSMEINADGTPFQEGDHVRIKPVGDPRRIDATDGGVVYLLMDGINESELFAASVDKDAYFIELITTMENTNDNYRHFSRATK
jgi:hypothetical protein